jgi:glycine cleavage system T protein (aminomethyltransferase)
MSAAEEHLATRRAAGLFDFSFMGLYEFSDRSSLQGLQTRNLDALAPGQIAYTLLLNDDGSVFNDATVWRLDADRFWLFTGRRSDFERLRGVARDRSGEYAILALQGPASGRILSRLIGSEAVGALRYFHFVRHYDMTVARLGYSGELGYELLGPAGNGPGLRQRLVEAGRSDGLRECGWAAADSLRIEAGYVLFDREVDGEANPHELGLEHLVDTRKNFEVTRRLVGLEILDEPGRADLPAGRVTSECFSPTLGKVLALGFVGPKTGAGSAVRLRDGRIARVAMLPFYDPERRRRRDNPL